MAFAKELASISLAAQKIDVPIRPNIFYGDGIIKMHEAVQKANDGPPNKNSYPDT